MGFFFLKKKKIKFYLFLFNSMLGFIPHVKKLSVMEKDVHVDGKNGCNEPKPIMKKETETETETETDIEIKIKMEKEYPNFPIGDSSTPVGKFWFNLQDQYIAPFFLQNTVFGFDVINQVFPYIKGQGTILDIGAHIGSHAISYAYINPNVDILAFEIQTPIFYLLQRNIKRNNAIRVQPIHAAVGHQVGFAQVSSLILDGYNRELKYGDYQTRNYGGVSVGQGGERVSMISIDSLNLTSCQFIKIDVEGFEPLVIQGASKTLQAFHPPVLYEHNFKTITPEMRSFFGWDPKVVIPSTEDQLRQLGYTIFQRLGPDILARTS